MFNLILNIYDESCFKEIHYYHNIKEAQHMNYSLSPFVRVSLSKLTGNTKITIPMETKTYISL